MKSSLILLVVSIVLSSVPATLRAEASPVDNVIVQLRQAKDSKEPVPILESARKEFDGVKAAPRGAGAVGPKKHAGLIEAGHEHKQKALEAIDGAIAAAKSGGDVKSKIEHAIAEVHSFNDLKH